VPDVYTRVTEADPAILDALMAALELRAADPQLRAMLTEYLTDAALPRGARVLEVGKPLKLTAAGFSLCGRPYSTRTW
jgi:hypothetical protein